MNTSGLIELMGGDNVLISKLDHLFKLDSSNEKFSEVEDIAGLIGQYAHGNEPSHNTAYLYVYAGVPWKTQGILYRIMNELYNNTPMGSRGMKIVARCQHGIFLHLSVFILLPPGAISM